MVLEFDFVEGGLTGVSTSSCVLVVAHGSLSKFDRSRKYDNPNGILGKFGACVTRNRRPFNVEALRYDI